MWNHAIRKTACHLVLCTVVALLFVAGTTMSASAASMQTTAASKTGATPPPPPPNGFQQGMNKGIADGQSQCLLGITVPFVQSSSPVLGFDQGYAQGLTLGYRQGCPAVTQAPPGQTGQTGQGIPVSQTTPQTPNVFQEGVNAGFTDGQIECGQQKPAPIVLRVDVRPGFNAGYAQGLTTGFQQAGC